MLCFIKYLRLKDWIFFIVLQAPVLLQILEKMRDDHHPFYPQVLMVDGNGILHPRGEPKQKRSC